MSLKKWLAASLLVVIFAAAIVIIITAALMKWRKQANYPPASNNITARGSITFTYICDEINLKDSGNYKGYIRLNPAQSVIGFIGFQSSLNRNNLTISDVRLLFPAHQFTLNYSTLKACIIEKHIDKPIFFVINGEVAMSFSCDTVKLEINKKDTKIIYGSCGVVSHNESQKLSPAYLKEIADSFLKDIKHSVLTLSVSFKQCNASGLKDQSVYVVSKIVLKAF